MRRAVPKPRGAGAAGLSSGARLMDLDTYTRFALALMLVLGLIFLMAALLRRFGSVAGAAAGGRGARRRLGVVEGAVVDSRRRLVLVRRDDREHLLLIGGVTDLVVERDIVPPAMSEPPGEATTPSFRAILTRGQRAGSP